MSQNKNKYCTEETLNRDGYSKTLSIPRALYAIPILSETERLIIAKIVGLSSKYVDKGGCNLTNNELAEKHRCKNPVVARAIAKARWLGIQKNRKDIKKKIGNNAFSQERKLIFVIPDFWEFFGEVWGELYFTPHCEASKQIQFWLDDLVKNLYKQWCDRKEEINNKCKQGKISKEMEKRKKSVEEEIIDIKYVMDTFYQTFLEETDTMHNNLETPSFEEPKTTMHNNLETPSFEKFKTPFLNCYALTFSESTFPDPTFSGKSIPKGMHIAGSNEPAENNNECLDNFSSSGESSNYSSNYTISDLSPDDFITDTTDNLSKEDTTDNLSKEDTTDNPSNRMRNKVKEKANRNSPKNPSKKSFNKTIPKNRPIYKADNLPSEITELPFYNLTNYEIIQLWNELAKQHNFSKLNINRPSVRLSKTFHYLEMLKKGKFGETVKIPANGIPEQYYTKKYTPKEIKYVINQFPELLREGNWPQSKDWLYKLNLEKFLFSLSTSNSGHPKSHFINLAYNGVKKTKTPNKKKDRKTDYNDKTEFMPNAEFSPMPPSYNDKGEHMEDLLKSEEIDYN